jgi:hypothetical protein
VKTEILFNYFKNRYADFGKVAWFIKDIETNF